MASRYKFTPSNLGWSLTSARLVTSVYHQILAYNECCVVTGQKRDRSRNIIRLTEADCTVWCPRDTFRVACELGLGSP
jgi:hypothetical protein